VQAISLPYFSNGGIDVRFIFLTIKENINIIDLWKQWEISVFG
jgi:hypothetical protein